MNVYIDDTTGKYYIWDGNKFWEYGDEVTLKPKLGAPDSGTPDDVISQAEAELRQELLDQEEAGDEELKKLNQQAKDKDSRVKDISRRMNSKDFSQGIENDRIKVSQREREKDRALARKSASVYRGIAGGINIFKKDLSKLISDQVREVEMASWSRPNRRYVSTPFIMPGTRMDDNPQIPTIRVYFDRSASWDQRKIAEGKMIIESIVKDYVKKKKLVMEVLYFGDYISYDPNSNGGGTYGQPIMEDIKKYKPQNVVIMTDSDIRDLTETTVVPGGVFLLFKDGISLNLQDHIHGKKLTKSYEI